MEIILASIPLSWLLVLGVKALDRLPAKKVNEIAEKFIVLGLMAVIVLSYLLVTA